MKWRGRRQSTNVEDMRGKSLSIKDIIDEDARYNGGIIPGDNEIKINRKKDGTVVVNKDTEYNPDDPKELEVVKKLGKYSINKTTPIPTPKPKITRTQVTPGKWITK